MNEDEQMMQRALGQARKAAALGEVPVGAVLTLQGQVVAEACNSPISLHDPSAHAELLALRKGGAVMGNYRLTGTTLYVTLEPCIMCVGALLHARVERLVYGAKDPKGGALVSLYRLADDKRFNHTLVVRGGVLEGACAEILSGFFQGKRLVSRPVSRIGCCVTR